MTQQTTTQTKMEKGTIKQPVRTTYVSKFERYVLSQALDYWIKNAPKTPLENLMIDKFKEVKSKFDFKDK